MSPSKAIVIGGGFGGMAAALRARKKGYDILLIDRCPRLGGRAQVFERGGYRHDAGPTVITAPFLFEELFTLHLASDSKDYVQLVNSRPLVPLPLPGRQLTFNYGGKLSRTRSRRNRANLSRRLPRVPVRWWRSFEKDLCRSASSSWPHKPFHRPWNDDRAAADPRLARVGRLPKSVWQLVTQVISSHPWLRRAFSVSPSAGRRQSL